MLAYQGTLMKLALPLAFPLILSSTLALAQQPKPATPARQDIAALGQVAQQFLEAQTAGLPGQVTISIGNIDQRMQLAACPAPQAFQQPGARPWGKTTVGVRCAAPTAWTVYIQAQVSVLGQYVAAAVPLVQGKPIDASQLVMVSGDLSLMPNNVATSMEQAIGRSSNMALAAGSPLRLDALKSQPVVQQGQAVRVVSKGANFSVSAEARAIGTASDGQVVQVRTGNGAILSGVAKAGGTVEVVF
jgi:flagella basal body P-ring formation protein FlgA